MEEDVPSISEPVEPSTTAVVTVDKADDVATINKDDKAVKPHFEVKVLPSAISKKNDDEHSVSVTEVEVVHVKGDKIKDGQYIIMVILRIIVIVMQLG